MSRETDNSSPGSQGRGGAAYPSGTPPYGTPAQGAAAEEGADAERQGAGAPAEERRTETTLTTRVRINIPGSRPIPPVVMRTPMSDLAPDVTKAAKAAKAAASADPAGEGAGRSADGPAEGAADAPAGPTSDWFAPRKPTASRGGATAPGTGPVGDPSEHGQGGPADPFGGGPFTDRSEYSGYAEHPEGAGSAGASGPLAPGGIDPKALGGPGAGNRSGLYDLFGEPSASSAESASKPGGEQGAGAGDVSGDGPGGAPGPERGRGTFDVTGALASGPLGTGASGGGPRSSDLSYFPETSQEAAAQRSGLPRRPTGPTGGPVTGDSALASAGGTGRTSGGPLGGAPGTPGGPGAPGAPKAPAAGVPGGAGAPGGPGGSRPRMSDDTAVLTPQKPAPDRGNPEDNVSGHTVTSGIPVVPSPQNSPFGQPPGESEGGVPHTPPKLPGPGARSAPAASAPKKKGRSKLVLLAGLVVVLAGGVYGAGLLVNHADVPKGTTVLGVDIGGGTRDEAVKKLDAAFGDRTGMALKLAVGGKSVPLRPDQAGLALDTDATVQAAAGSDYNPMTVVGSLFGGKRVIQPVMPVDAEKLHAALERAAGGAGTATEGTIRFEQGRAVAVYGKAGKAVDVDQSAEAVEHAYRTQVESGRPSQVRVPLTERRPTVSNAEVDRMMREFAEPAMSGIVTIKAGSASIPFGPEKSLPQILGVQAVDGKLVDTYDRAAVKKLYGTTFDGVLVTRGNGKKTPVTPEDVIGVMRKALLGKTPAERVGVIETDPS
ncbi:hypothetical protein GCM10018793_38640 [Streptomyces sulfonofaciens]|uniref:Peptidoglycan binding domain-containing protein n=1 Tax=Streptomyces sulfonofaciens TaxID=68272 RepID=A0A919GBC7_9ACTN|nr:hypothetical protein [Streptomyces sulfonofaciens]GHH81395.1 hypothetical protein GCM10018793_38640 [Streptomyces sulfonofaciens]